MANGAAPHGSVLVEEEEEEEEDRNSESMARGGMACILLYLMTPSDEPAAWLHSSAHHVQADLLGAALNRPRHSKHELVIT